MRRAIPRCSRPNQQGTPSTSASVELTALLDEPVKTAQICDLACTFAGGFAPVCVSVEVAHGIPIIDRWESTGTFYPADTNTQQKFAYVRLETCAINSQFGCGQPAYCPYDRPPCAARRQHGWLRSHHRVRPGGDGRGRIGAYHVTYWVSYYTRRLAVRLTARYRPAAPRVPAVSRASVPMEPVLMKPVPWALAPTALAVPTGPPVKLSSLAALALPSSSAPVSYTHLRAHET